MIKVRVQVDDDVLDAIDDAARKSPRLMKTVYDRNTRRLRKRMLDRLREKPDRPKYPLRWKSERQRRYVLAKLRREGNLPYQRTDNYVNAFDVRLVSDDRGGILEVTNDDPKAPFVGGDDAQPMHLDTGWNQIAEVVAEFDEEAEDVLVESWFTVVDPFAGVG